MSTGQCVAAMYTSLLVDHGPFMLCSCLLLQDPYEPEDEDDYELKPGKGKADGQQVCIQTQHVPALASSLLVQCVALTAPLRSIGVSELNI